MGNVKLKYFKNLDGLRGIAAFSVIIFHFFLNSKVTNDIENIEVVKSTTKILQHGVTLFFVLSGFVITRILINTKGYNNYFSRFYKRRILRIFPLYYFYLIIHFYVFPTLLEGQPNLEFFKQMPMYLYLQNMSWLTGLEVIGPGHFWSLAVEEHFYLLWPLIVFLVPKRSLKTVIIILIVASIPVKIFFYNNGIDINYNTFSRYDSIMIGCLIAILEWESGYSLKRLSSKKLITFLFAILSIGSVLYLNQASLLFFKSISKHIILSAFFGVIIYLLITTKNNNNLFNRILNKQIMQYFGKISYGLYVWHMMSITIVSLFDINNFIINFLLTLIFTIIMAHLSYFYFEKYFLKLK